MRVDETPFQPAWWGQELESVRPRVGTYGRYPHNQLPALPFELRGDFQWLMRQPTQRNNIASEKPADNAAALASLLADAGARGVTLPPEFLTFVRSKELHRRVRSCTDCFIDLSPKCAASPLADGVLLRFLADSQGCLFWYVYQSAGSADHCVVASQDFYGDEAEQSPDDPPDPQKLVFCEESFERFICRFWLENEIWFSDYEKRPLSAEGRRYLDGYGREA